jgi:hypothetical protein
MMEMSARNSPKEHQMTSSQPPTRAPLKFHADCIYAARQGDERSVCRDCFKEAWSILGPQRSVTAKYEAGLFIVGYHNQDGSVDLGQALDDGGLFDPE